MLQLHASTELVNDYLSDPLHAYANASRPEATVAKIDAIAEARARIGANVAPLLAIEAMMVSLRPAK
jgi:DNA polymerase-3 subunit delta'